MAERDEASEALAALGQFREQTGRLRPPPGARARALAAIAGGEAALESFRVSSAERRPPPGAKERVLAAVEGRGQRPVALRPRARVALVLVGLLVASSVGAMTLPGVSLPRSLLPGLAPSPTPTVPPLGPARTAAPRADARPAGGKAAGGPEAAAPSASPPEAAPAGGAEVTPSPAGAPQAAPGAEPGSAVPAGPGEGKGHGAARRPAEPHGSSDTLAQQVGEYQRALALAGRNDEAALVAWRSFVRRWPTSSLRHEVDLQIVAALGRLGRRGELEAAARGFLRDHPHSPRSGDVRKVLRSGGHLASHRGRGLRMAERSGRRQRWPSLPGRRQGWPSLLVGVLALAFVHCTDDLDLGSFERQEGAAGRDDVAGRAGAAGAAGADAGGAGGAEACGAGGDCQAGGAAGEGPDEECDNSGPGNCDDDDGDGGDGGDGDGGSSGTPG
ncbi:MAG TPA: hypothetical protein VFS43_32970 [Polyangiaceae bacterium]|nr:hypothetical protein [Polyangiaceae bacterium]